MWCSIRRPLIPSAGPGPAMWGWAGEQKESSSALCAQGKEPWYLSTKVVLNEDKLPLCPRLNGPWQTVTAPPPLKAWPNLKRRCPLQRGTCSSVFLRRRNIYVSEMCLLRVFRSWVFPEAFWKGGFRKLHHISSPLFLSVCSPEGPLPVPTLWCMSICRVY